MMKYNIVYTLEAEADLFSIHNYISIQLKVPSIAKRQVETLISSINKLNNLPLRHRLYPKEPWYSRGLRFFPVGNYLVFYIIEEESNTVTIIRIMYKKRNIDKQLDSYEYNTE